MQNVCKISCEPDPGLRMKSFSVLFFCITFCVQESMSQISDDFSDGDFYTNPAWSGTVEYFRINEDQELQLNASTAGTAWLTTPFEAEPSSTIEWEFLIRQTFAPSGSNFSRFYLVSDRPDLSGEVNGYYLRFGETGSADAVELYRQTASQRTLLCRGNEASIANAFTARVKVRYHEGSWELYADYSGGNNLNLEATASDDLTVQGTHIGLICTYTVSNATRFFFDDIAVRAAPGQGTKRVEFRDVIISEIMADPSPAIHLPEAEFVELYNRGERAINLSGWSLSDPSTSAMLSPYVLEPGQYVTITGRLHTSAFEKFGAVVSVASLPSLNNDGDILYLKMPGGRIIDSVAYKNTWYRDIDKANGGWSLEIIDPDDFCRGADNWSAGGTPGTQNSVHARRPDTFGPKLLSVIALDSLTLLVKFDERLHADLPSSQDFQIDGVQMIGNVSFGNEEKSSFLLSLMAPLLPGRNYSLQVNGVRDCPGNLSESQTREFALPEEARLGDVVLNEILFNPRPTGVDFVEVYNRSGKVINIRNWSLRNIASAQRRRFIITPEHTTILPKEYKVVVSDGNVLKGEYINALENAFLETTIPPLNDGEGSLVLLDREGVVIDSIHYTKEMHSPFVKDDEGVSLERISSEIDGSDPVNWRSASSDSGFATPGYRNSNSREGNLNDPGDVVVEPEILQPGVQTQDFALIKYRFDQGGLIANVKVIDQKGRSVRILAENEMLGTEGIFRWDGDTERGVYAATGQYMVWFEVFSAEGAVRTFRKRVVIY